METFLVLEKLENEGLTKILPAAIGKMGIKSTLGFRYFEANKSHCEEMKKLSRDANPRGENCGLASFCYLCKVRKPVQCSRLLHKFCAVVLL